MEAESAACQDCGFLPLTHGEMRSHALRKWPFFLLVSRLVAALKLCVLHGQCGDFPNGRTKSLRRKVESKQTETGSKEKQAMPDETIPNLLRENRRFSRNM